MRRPFLLLLAVAGCRAAEEPRVSQERVVLTPERSAPRETPRKPPEWFDAQIAAAERDLEEGRYEDAFARLYQARAEQPAPVHAAGIADLLGRLNQGVLDLETVRGRVEPFREPITFEEAVRVRVRLENAGARTVRIPARARGVSPSLFVLDVVRRDYDVFARTVETRRRVFRELKEDLEIPAGGTAELLLEVPGTGNDRPLDGFRIFRVGGRLRASVVEVGGLRRWDAVRLAPASLRSFRPNYEHLADDPLARVAQALEKEASVHLLTACALLPYGQRGEAVDRLVAALGRGRPIDWAVLASVQYLTGVTELGPDADAWRAWWPRVREGYFPPVPEVGTGEPTFAR